MSLRSETLQPASKDRNGGVMNTLNSTWLKRCFKVFGCRNWVGSQGRPLGGATGAVAPGPVPRDERNRTPPTHPHPPPPPRNAIANGPRGAPLHTSHRAPRQPGTALLAVHVNSAHRAHRAVFTEHCWQIAPHYVFCEAHIERTFQIHEEINCAISQVKSTLFVQHFSHYKYPLSTLSTSRNQVLVQSQCSCQFLVGSTGEPFKNRLLFHRLESQYRARSYVTEYVSCFVSLARPW